MSSGWGIWIPNLTADRQREVWGFGTGSSSQYRHEGSRNDGLSDRDVKYCQPSREEEEKISRIISVQMGALSLPPAYG
jgi:hypothetical protein